MVKNGTTYMTIGDFSSKLNIHQDTIRRWTKTGYINCFRTKGGHRRFTPKELDRVIRRATKR